MLVVIYHVIYIFNGVTQHGIIGPFSEHQPQDIYQYIFFVVLLSDMGEMSVIFGSYPGRRML